MKDDKYDIETRHYSHDIVSSALLGLLNCVQLYHAYVVLVTAQ